jgi:hypothetical protein
MESEHYPRKICIWIKIDKDHVPVSLLQRETYATILAILAIL